MPSEPVLKRHSERRTLRRFSMKLPLAVRVSGIPSEFLTETENVSARGIFFYIDRWMAKGVRLEVAISFSSQLTMTEPVRVLLRARVVRVVPGKSTSLSGVAALFNSSRLQFLPDGDQLENSVEPEPSSVATPVEAAEPAGIQAAARE
jgi:hypothetical protein